MNMGEGWTNMGGGVDKHRGGVDKHGGGGQSQGRGDKVGTSGPGCLYHTATRCFALKGLRTSAT